MKLIRFGPKGAETPGVIIDGQRRSCAQYFEDWNHNFFVNNGLVELRKIIELQSDQLELVPESERWGACIARPGMIMCIGLNYSDHAKEAGMDIPTEPIIFSKATNTIAGPNDPVTIPKGSTKTDWEVELGIVIGKDCSYLDDPKSAMDHIAGYCIVHDISERQFQLEQGGQWVKGKSCPGFSPIGPYLVTKDEIPDVKNLEMYLNVNKQRMQTGTTQTMIFDVEHVTHYLSQYMLLEAGDLISTGTPPGVGLGMNPPVYLKDGDEVELGIEFLGKQKQTFVRYPQ